MALEGGKVTPVMLEQKIAALERIQAVHDMVDQIVKIGGSADYMQCDVSDPIATASVIQKICETENRVDVLIHAAGVEKSRKIETKSVGRIPTDSGSQSRWFPEPVPVRSNPRVNFPSRWCSSPRWRDALAIPGRPITVPGTISFPNMAAWLPPKLSRYAGGIDRLGRLGGSGYGEPGFDTAADGAFRDRNDEPATGGSDGLPGASRGGKRRGCDRRFPGSDGSIGDREMRIRLPESRSSLTGRWFDSQDVFPPGRLR